MVQVEFHTGMAEPVAFACRLLRKAYRQSTRVAVTAPAQVVGALDRALWTFDERDFVPHIRLGPGHSASAVAVRTPLWLLDEALLAQGWPEGMPQVLVNLGAALPLDALPVTRLIEIVARDADEADRARLRWRHYRSLNWNVVHHNASAAA
jgi:DNA polymerase III subunit chi